ncbi:MAG: IS3 family transposase [Lentilactobacillus diolivorans]|uniref:IS3 family transposase n=1 Tax=Lactobacillaceae TaxID=33958 RepID=UPI001EE75F60|nr:MULTISPECIES: IS3 family transposase [Lactobacillaceae]MCH4163767.1 IS3 family transposase [Lentilactobacillus diolivorans]
MIHFIQDEGFEVKMATKLFNISRSTFYDVIHREPSNRAIESQRISEAIEMIYHQSDGIYGAPKIQFLLGRDYQLNIGLKRVQRLMKQLGLHSIVTKKYRPQTNHQPVEDRFNILQQDFFANGPNQKWVADITYIPTVKDGWTYLASVMDLFSRKIIGYAYSQKMDTDLVITALGNAALNRRPVDQGVIIHTDLGAQYTSTDFELSIHQMGMYHSYSRKGTPYDNAGIESFHSIIKKEEVYVTTYQNFEQARVRLFQYIEGWYNRKRIHSSLHYLTPVEFENKFSMS